MILNINQAVRVIKNLFIDLMSTSSLTLDITKIENIGFDKYKISLTIYRIGSVDGFDYIITYNAIQNVIENIEKKE